MNIDVIASNDIKTSGGGIVPPCTGLTSDALPEVRKPVLVENSDTGVSTKNAQSATNLESDGKHWYALRTTYGREKKAYDYIIAKGGTAFYPTLTTTKVIKGKRKQVEESRLPNIFFAYGTSEEIKSFVYDNVNLPFLRFYYRHVHIGRRIEKIPLIVPDYQMESLKIICASEAEDIILVPSDVEKFKTGQTVRVIEGVFKGAIGKVVRFQGQQRIGIVIDGLMTVASAYVPSAFLENII